MKKTRQHAAQDKQIAAAWSRLANGIQINVMNIGQVFTIGRAALDSGRDLDAAIVAAIATYREN